MVESYELIVFSKQKYWFCLGIQNDVLYRYLYLDGVMKKLYFSDIIYNFKVIHYYITNSAISIHYVCLLVYGIFKLKFMLKLKTISLILIRQNQT